MAQIAEQYGKVLYELRISHEDVESVRKTLETVPELIKILDNPVLSKKQKHTVVEKVFPKSVHNFLKTVSDGADRRNSGWMEFLCATGRKSAGSNTFLCS